MRKIPTRGFLPQTGRIERLSFLPPGNEVRIDSGVSEGDVISPSLRSADRQADRLGHRSRPCGAGTGGCPGANAIAGVATNVSFLSRLVRHENFVPATSTRSSSPDMKTICSSRRESPRAGAADGRDRGSRLAGATTGNEGPLRSMVAKRWLETQHRAPDDRSSSSAHPRSRTPSPSAIFPSPAARCGFRWPARPSSRCSATTAGSRAPRRRTLCGRISPVGGGLDPFRRRRHAAVQAHDPVAEARRAPHSRGSILCAHAGPGPA